MGGTVKKHTSNAKGILVIAFLVFAVIVGALVFKKYDTATRVVEPPRESVPIAGTTVVTLFFAAQDGEGLVREGREVKMVDGNLIEIDIEKERAKIQMKREQGAARTIDELVALGVKRGYRSPRLWAINLMRARGGK